MSDEGIVYSVFTKPWKQMPIAELGRFVNDLGFDGIELPLRPGYPVAPEDVTKGLPQAVRHLADCGVKILSVAGATDEATIAACGECGVGVIRVMVQIGREGYMATIEEVRRQYDALVPLLDRHGVTIGAQNHCGRFVSSAMGLRHLLDGYEPKHVAAVLDLAHCGLDGEPEELAIEIAWPHLCMVNLKNAVWERADEAGAETAEWRHRWVGGREGLSSWPKVAAELKKRKYAGIVCLTAEYSDQEAVDRLIAEDVAFAKSLFA